MNRNIWKNTRDSYRHQEVRANKSITMGMVGGPVTSCCKRNIYRVILFVSRIFKVTVDSLQYRRCWTIQNGLLNCDNSQVHWQTINIWYTNLENISHYNTLYKGKLILQKHVIHWLDGSKFTEKLVTFGPVSWNNYVITLRSNFRLSFIICIQLTASKQKTSLIKPNIVCLYNSSHVD